MKLTVSTPTAAPSPLRTGVPIHAAAGAPSAALSAAVSYGRPEQVQPPLEDRIVPARADARLQMHLAQAGVDVVHRQLAPRQRHVDGDFEYRRVAHEFPVKTRFKGASRCPFDIRQDAKSRIGLSTNRVTRR